jgi:hypothetical protein
VVRLDVCRHRPGVLVLLAEPTRGLLLDIGPCSVVDHTRFLIQHRYQHLGEFHGLTEFL